MDAIWADRFDWNKTKTTVLPDGSIFRQEDATKLQKYRGAKPFRVESRWSYTVTGTIPVVEDKRTGKLRITGPAKLQWRRNIARVR